MSEENSRSRREARIDDQAQDDSPAGHGIADVGARRESRDGSIPEQEEPEVRRTQRGSSESQEEAPPRRTSRNTGPSGPVTTPIGNTSETGATPPTQQAPQQRSPRQMPGKPPVGCTTSSASMLIVLAGIVTAASKLLRR